MPRTRPTTLRRLVVQSRESRQLMAGDTIGVDLIGSGGGILNSFSSKHTGGANFCFADGSVRMVRDSIATTAESVDAAMTDDPFFFDVIKV